MSAPERTYVAATERLQLRPLDEGDIDTIAEWIEDDELRRSAFLTEERRDGREKLRQALAFSAQVPEVATWGFDNREGRLVGMGNWRPDYPFLWVYEIEVVIGPREPKRAGYGTEAHRLLVDHLFETVRPAKVFGRFALFNEAIRKLVRNLGGTEEGLLRAHARLGEDPVDILLAGFLLDEWENSPWAHSSSLTLAGAAQS